MNLYSTGTGTLPKVEIPSQFLNMLRYPYETGKANKNMSEWNL